MINSVLAKKIVTKMMDIIPYNINIIDKNGIIIASGDEQRVGQVHFAAIEALKNEKAVEINNSDKFVKAGVNIPINFNNRIIGVIGITGKPEEVRRFAEIVRVTAELLINQEYSIQKYIVKTKIKEEYIYEWLYRREEYDEDFITRGKLLDINLNALKNIVLIEYSKGNSDKLKKNIKLFMADNEYLININSNKILLILTKEINFIENFIIKNEDLIQRTSFIDMKNILSLEFAKILVAINMANKINFDLKIIKDDNIEFLFSLEKLILNDDNQKIIENIKLQGNELLDTFIVLIASNCEKNITAKKLHIHRNTLAYRIGKIEEITKLSFNNYIDCFRLRSACFYYKIKYSK